MKNKNRPRRTKPKPKKPTRQKPFNSWVYKYFRMTEENDENRRKLERETDERPHCK